MREQPSIDPFVQAVRSYPSARAFRVQNWEADDPGEWQLQPMDVEVLSDEEGGPELFVIAALNVLPDGRVRDCYMDMNLPERINDYAFFVEDGVLRHGYTHEFNGEIIPAIAIDCFGVYELFYSKLRPEIGIEVLKRGLSASKRKHFIAEDLGYIYSDERRYREAAEMFQIAADEEVSSYFIYGELALAYGMIGDVENERKYMDRYHRAAGAQ